MANLLIEKKERIGIVAVNRPEQLNPALWGGWLLYIPLSIYSLRVA